MQMGPPLNPKPHPPPKLWGLALKTQWKIDTIKNEKFIMQMGPPINPKPHLTLNPIPLFSQSHPKPMIPGGYLVGTH